MTGPDDDLRAAVRLGALDPGLNLSRFWATAQWGPGIAAMVGAAALRFPTRAAVIDETATVDYRTLDRLATGLAAEFRRRKGAVGILCRNHSGFLVAQVAAERAGADAILMSTALPAPNMANVLVREKVRILVADREFHPLIDQSGADVDLIDADGDGPASIACLASGRAVCPPPPQRRSRLVLLTSGTTGPPKGARRANRAPRLNDLGLMSRIPYRLGDNYLVAPPLFHAWGLSQATSAMATASTLTLRRQFEAAETAQLLTERRYDVLAVVPLMLRRLLRESTSVDGLIPPRIVASSGNVLSGDLATAWMDRFGDRLYNLYGSTEAAIGTIAGPADLRASPGTVGRPPRGVTLSIFDERSMPVPVGETGRIFLSSSSQFAGYTDGTSGERSGTLLATGDLGHLDRAGLLHVNGRANDMIVTGGENVFPSRVEEVLDRQPGVETSAVVGVADEEYGERVVAYVVRSPDALIDADQLRQAAAGELPGFMVPKQLLFVEALPMTTTGKVIRHRLAVLGDAAHI